MERLHFRKLTTDEIEVRVSQVREGRDKNIYVSLLLYKDARVDQRLLDETVGPYNWQREHYNIGQQQFCKVGIWDAEKGMWVWKADTGTESNMEAQKGLSSDCFKRACFNWGIGRELYTAPGVYFALADNEVSAGRNGALQCRQSFRVKDIGYDGDNISRLVIVDRNGNERYRYGVR